MWSGSLGTRGMKGDSSNPLCSRNARPQKALVGRAQLRITGSHPSESGVTSELGGSIGRTILMVSCR